MQEQLPTQAGFDGFMLCELRLFGQILAPHEILLKSESCQPARVAAAAVAPDHFFELRQAHKQRRPGLRYP